MIKYLTSDFKNYEKVNGEKITKPIDNTNGFVDSLKSNLKKTEKIVFVVSDGHQEHEKNMVYLIRTKRKERNYILMNIVYLKMQLEIKPVNILLVLILYFYVEEELPIK